jgi:hypothetical protein
MGNDPERGAEVAAHVDRWCGYLADGLPRMRTNGLLRTDADPERLALSTFAALHGGLLLTPTKCSIEPLEAALDGALITLKAFAVASIE